MAITTVPFKTPLGNEELRTRVHKLGQRHRTILFLIDGRRPLAEVLSLAHQAGSATSHFEDLLRMGLVDLPPEPAPPPLLREIPTLTDEANVTSVDMVVLEAVVEQSDLPPLARLDAGAPVKLPESPPVRIEPAQPPTQPPAPPAEVHEVLSSLAQPKPAKPAKGANKPVPTLDLHEHPEDLFERTVRFPPRVPKEAPEEPPEDPFERTQRNFERYQAPVELPPAAPPAPKSEPFKTRPPKGPTRTLPVLSDEPIWATPAPAEPKQESRNVPMPVPDRDEAELLQQIRELLTDALRLDAPLFSARTFMRVRSAQSTGDLIDLVWEIEDHLSHKRRSRRELQSLQRARELLGLGNTLVAGDDSRPDYLDED